MVSVIIPTYNRAELIGRAVKSVLNQSFRDFELIVVDDGSSDQTRETVESFHDPRLRLIEQEHQGVSKARNRGIKESVGKWISFLDSDDAWQPNKLQRQIESLEEDFRYRVVYTNEIWIRNGVRVNQKKKHRKYSGWIYPYCLPLCIVSPSSVFLHREIIEIENGFDEDYPVCEDYELWLRISCHYPIRFLNEFLIFKYGGHDDQLSRSRWGLDIYRVKALEKIYNSGRLTPYLALLTAREITRKSRILAKGFLNHGKLTDAESYQRLASEYDRKSSLHFQIARGLSSI
jgi:glycosyltransferase involved in cell wall biosynthesis